MSDGTNPDPANAMYTAMGAEANFVAAGQAAAITEQANWIASGHTGISPKALQIFGNFTHPLVDATSPAHEGFQPWNGCTRVSNIIGGACLSLGGIWHGLKETPLAFTGQRKADAISVIQYYFLQTFGQDAYQQATKASIRRATHVGSKEFVRRMEAESGRRPRVLERGRPPKDGKALPSEGQGSLFG